MLFSFGMGRLLSKPLQGSLNLLILKTLSRGPLHGYAITNHIQQVSDEVLQVEEGSLYPALHRMEQEGWIVSEWALSDTNRRVRYYTLTVKGKRQLALEENDWRQITAAVSKVLKFV
jgi:transcriptional regulator